MRKLGLCSAPSKVWPTQAYMHSRACLWKNQTISCMLKHGNNTLSLNINVLSNTSLQHVYFLKLIMTQDKNQIFVLQCEYIRILTNSIW
jgi:hypothetical protein